MGGSKGAPVIQFGMTGVVPLSDSLTRKGARLFSSYLEAVVFAITAPLFNAGPPGQRMSVLYEERLLAIVRRWQHVDLAQYGTPAVVPRQAPELIRKLFISPDVIPGRPLIKNL